MFFLLPFIAIAIAIKNVCEKLYTQIYIFMPWHCNFLSFLCMLLHNKKKAAIFHIYTILPTHSLIFFATYVLWTQWMKKKKKKKIGVEKWQWNNIPLATGETIKIFASAAPWPCPISVTIFGLPLNAGKFSRSQCKPATRSINPKFPWDDAFVPVFKNPVWKNE